MASSSWSCVLCVFFALPAACLWGLGRTETSSNLPQMRASQSLPSNDTLADSYALAISQLQQLESEPLCHRIAARMLVNNCRLLEGQNDATVLTDSGRATRDFVDSYAASLAICDLERGSFAIPPACYKFREATLSAMPKPITPELHVSTFEIDSCLEGLARSDSAWNTWVSYRHKALGFCEAARVENEKDSNIHLYKRVTEIMARLTTRVEADLETRFQELNETLLDTRANMESINPQVDDIKESLFQIERLICDVLSAKLEEAATSIRAGVVDAKSLQHVLSELSTIVLEAGVDITRSQEASMHGVAQRFEDRVGSIFEALEAALVTSISLQERLTDSEFHAIEINMQQQRMETSLDTLLGLANALALKYKDHHDSLQQAQQVASHVQEILDSVTLSATTFRSSLIGAFGVGKWWPYVVCPALSLIVGSYGLPPSATRNILLVGLGEAVGSAIFGLSQFSQRQPATGGPSPNDTSNATGICFAADLPSSAWAPRGI